MYVRDEHGGADKDVVRRFVAWGQKLASYEVQDASVAGPSLA
jgi:hypothetical protein